MDEKIANTEKKIKVFDKVRIISLLFTLLLLTLIWLGNKIFEEALWYQDTVVVIYQFVFIGVVITVISVFIKFYYYNKYRILIRRKKSS